jgi:hypothetical protein
MHRGAKRIDEPRRMVRCAMSRICIPPPRELLHDRISLHNRAAFTAPTAKRDPNRKQVLASRAHEYQLLVEETTDHQQHSPRDRQSRRRSRRLCGRFASAFAGSSSFSWTV